jgi:hypothetical protein
MTHIISDIESKPGIILTFNLGYLSKNRDDNLIKKCGNLTGKLPVSL